MTLSERTAYLKGLMEGMKLDTETNEGKLFKAIIETLDDIALTVTDMEDVVDAVCDELDSIEEDLDNIEDYLLDEDEDAYCVWRAEFSPRRRVCTYGMDLFFREKDGLWRREEEVHREYAYEPAELAELLRQAGFRQIREYGELKLRAPRPGEGRVFFAARKDF